MFKAPFLEVDKPPDPQVSMYISLECFVTVECDVFFETKIIQSTAN